MSRRWTDHEDAVLRELYPTMSSIDIASILVTRSVAAIHIRAHRDLGINKLGPSRIDRPFPSDELRAYTAGMVDGEGSIQINGSKNRRDAKAAYWSLTVQISSVDNAFLSALRDEWGVGSITTWKPKKGRRATNWRIYSAEAEWFMAACEPYLRLKAEQAKVAREFRAFVCTPSQSLTAELSEQRTRLAERMRELNAKTGKATAKPRAHQPL